MQWRFKSMKRGSVVAVIKIAVFLTMFFGFGEPIPQEVSSPGLTVNLKESLFTSEYNGMDDFQGALISEQTADATLGIFFNNTTEGIVDISRVTCDPGNCDIPQNVMVIGSDDATEVTFSPWSANYCSQLGDRTHDHKKIKNQIGTDTNWAFVAAGGSHSVALKTDGTLWSWGYNRHGQLGDGTTIHKFRPISISTDRNKVFVAA